MATKRIKDLTNTATASTLDANQYAVVDGSTGTFKTKLSELATWIHGRWASFVNALTAKTSFASGDKIPVVNGSTATAMSKDTLLSLTTQNAIDTAKPLFNNIDNEANFSITAQEDRFLRFEKSAAAGYDSIITSESKFLRVDKLKGLSFVRNNFFNPSASYNPLPYTSRDVTFESIGNGGVHVHGTATGGDSTCFVIRPFTFQANHVYLIRGCPSGGSTSTYFMSWGLSGDDIGEGKIYKPTSGSESYVYIRVKSGTNVDKVFYPQLVDLTMWFGAGNEPTTLAELDASTFPKSVIPYDTGTLKHAAVEKIKVFSGATEISSFEMPSDLLTYLSGKGYGQSYGSKTNVLDIEQRKYIKEGSFVGSSWVDDSQEYDVSEYIGDVTMKCAKNYILRTYSGADLLYTNADLSVINIVDNLKSDTDTNTDLSKYQVNGGAIMSGTEWNNVSEPLTYNHYVIPITGEKNILTVTAGAVHTFMCGVKNYVKPTASYTPVANLSDSWYRRIEIEAGKTWSFVVPEDVKYIILNKTDGGVSCVADFSLSQTTNNMLGELYDKTECLHHLKMCAQNVRDFSDGSGDGMPDEKVAEKLPLWKAHITDKLNGDFLSIIEWYPYFDRSQTIDAYETLFKQFYPYKYALPLVAPTYMLMSKHKGTFMNLQVLGRVRFNMPTLVCNINGYSVAVVAWVQSVADTPEDRMDSYANAIKVLSAFDKVILGGDFNTEVGMEELEVWTDAGYVLGNGGYWGEIITWSDRTPNDNIVTRGFYYEKFSSGEYLTSDHKNVTAELSFE